MTLKKDPNFKEKLTFCLKNDMRNLVNFNPSNGNLKMRTLMGYFCRKYVMFELKNTEELCRKKRLMVSKMTGEIR